MNTANAAGAAGMPRVTRPLIATGETRTVNLKQPVPVLILYWTAQPRSDGQVIFRNDVYDRDPATLAALNGTFRRLQ